MTEGKALPLAGVTVLEIGHSIAAPFAGMVLGELGADVIKLENPVTGDYCRGWGPPFVEENSACFESVNRGKRSITVDLKDEAEVARLREFVRDKVDVLIHNLKFRALDKFGLGAEELLRGKPGLIYCNLGAFGAEGPMRERPGYDPLMQAYSGMMSLMGENGRPPVRVGVSVVDAGAGMWAVIGIVSALYARKESGRGCVVDTSLYEAALGWMRIPMAEYLTSDKLPVREGSGMAQIVPYQAFRTADGYIMVLAGNDGLFRRMCAAMGCPDFATDARFETNAGRVRNREILIPALEALMAMRPSAEWAELLDGVSVPNGPIRTLDEVVADPQTRALDMLQTSPDGKVRLLGLPVSFDGVRPGFERRAPKLAEHNAEIF